MDKEGFRLKEKEYAQIPIFIFAIILIIPTIGIITKGNAYSKVTYMSVIGELVNLSKTTVSSFKGQYYVSVDSWIKTQGVFSLINLFAILIVNGLAFYLGRKGKNTGFLFFILGILAVLAVDDKWFDFWTFCSLVILACSWGINVVRRINRKANRKAKQELKGDAK